MEDDFAAIGRSYRETDVTTADRASALNDLYRGEFNGPMRLVAFNAVEGWSLDVSSEFAIEPQGQAILNVRS